MENWTNLSHIKLQIDFTTLDTEKTSTMMLKLNLKLVKIKILEYSEVLQYQ